MKLMPFIAIILSFPALGMFKAHEKDLLVQFYRAIKKSDAALVATLIKKDNSLANCSFREIREKRKDETGERETPLLMAIKDKKRSCDEIFTILLQAGAEVDTSAKNGLSPLLKALLFEREDYVVALLKCDANTYQPINIQGRYVDSLDLAKHMGLGQSYLKILEHRRARNNP